MQTCIKEIRKRQGLTQLELANKSGLSKNTIYSYESGKRNPTLCGLDCIAKALNISVKDLLVDNEKSNTEHKPKQRQKKERKNPLIVYPY